MEWVLIYVIAGASPVPGQTGSIATHSVEFKTEASCKAARDEIQTINEGGQGVVVSWCLPK
jgi:hypothetical protein